MATSQPLLQEKNSKGSTLDKIKAWVKKNPAGAALLGVGGLGGIYLLVKKSSANSATNSSTSSSSAIDPATGVPYATELADAEDSAASTSTVPDDGYVASGGYGGSSSGGGAGNSLADLEDWFSTNYPAASQATATTAATSTPATVNGPDNTITSTSTPQTTAPSAPATNLTPAQAVQAVASGTGIEQALQEEVPASQETSAQRHAQEVANKTLREALKS